MNVSYFRIVLKTLRRGHRVLARGFRGAALEATSSFDGHAGHRARHIAERRGGRDDIGEAHGAFASHITGGVTIREEPRSHSVNALRFDESDGLDGLGDTRWIPADF